MKTFNLSHILPAALVALMLPVSAFAHPGLFHGHALASGLVHPLSGLDHILAMLAVGLWAVQKGGKAMWLWPLSFVGVMLLGGLLGMEGMILPMIEPMIAASVLILGLLIASTSLLPLYAGAAIIGVFALFHGNAHGLEAPATSASLLYALGFISATAALHGAGIAVGLASRHGIWPNFVRAGGIATACAGGILLFV